MWKNSLKNVESDNNKILYETLLDFLQLNGTYFPNKPRIFLRLIFSNLQNDRFIRGKMNRNTKNVLNIAFL